MRFLLCDDHSLFRAGLELVLQDIEGDVEVSGVEDGESLLAETERDDDYDLVLLDLGLPGASGFEVLTRLRAKHPDLPVAVLSGSDSPGDMRNALDLGAIGYVPKSANGAILLAAIQLMLSGGVYVPPEMFAEESPTPSPKTRRSPSADAPQLSPRQREVLRLMAEGLTNAEIGEVLSIAQGTVKSHVMRVFEELRVDNRTEAALRYQAMTRKD